MHPPSRSPSWADTRSTPPGAHKRVGAVAGPDRWPPPAAFPVKDSFKPYS